jgi:ethanolamine ammonia-lyase small subunit
VIQPVVGDGLSAEAVQRHVPSLLPELLRACATEGWSTGRPIAVRHCRVGIMGDVGMVTGAQVVALLIGERPGLGVSDSLSVYLQWRPDAEGSDADRNVVAGIHGRGLSYGAAIRRTVVLARAMLRQRTSGVGLALETEEALGAPRSDETGSIEGG